jgi:transketolase
MIAVSPSKIRTWSILGSAGTFGSTIRELARDRDDLYVVTADLRNFSGLERFHNENPDRLVNVGIAEQSLVGVAAGLALEGLSVFATTYATFAAARALDPVRVDLGYMRSPVKLVGMGGGLSVGILGPTHIAIEDIAAMRCIPNMTVISPADCTEIAKTVEATASYSSPVYIRIGGGVPHSVVYRNDYEFEIGKAITLEEGEGVAFVATGSLVATALEVSSNLRELGINASVTNMHTIKPLDHSCLDKLAENATVIFTFEEHSVLGGLGSAVCEYVADSDNPPRVIRIGIEDYYPHAGDYDQLIRDTGLDTTTLTNRIIKALRKD